MIRGVVRQTIEALDYEKLTLRSVVEWYKTVLRLENPTQQEIAMADTQWIAACDTLALREGVPAGFLAYMLSQLAQQEHNLLVTAATEAVEAGLVAESE